MNKAQVIDMLDETDACDAALAWIICQEGTLENIYSNCKNSSWLNWLYTEIGLRDEYEFAEMKALKTYWFIRDNPDNPDNHNGAFEIYDEKCKLPWPIVRNALERMIDENSS